ncbi:MAG TPA: 2-oxo-4-hydroxy-4-carboxy-5-ureidoimidazoline decarboxylase [Mycobacterium sp.]|nr:2-oxo-4-hydroxy-4-carboxy-5-ureidoimidazoline decarboxylase [Mycobacterium sp.]
MLLHQGMGIEAYNALPMRRAVHAVYECCYSVALAAELARHRPYPDYDTLFRQADEMLFGLGVESLDGLLQAYPHISLTTGDQSVLLAQLASINRTRLSRMLGPEDGFHNW